MASKLQAVSLDFAKASRLLNVLLDSQVNDTNLTVESQIGYNSTSKRVTYYNGTAVRYLLTDADIDTNTSLGTSNTVVPSQNAVKTYVDNLVTGLGNFVGNHDASGGLLPTTGSGVASAIDKGDYWIVSVGGTIAGLGTVQAGDVIYARISAAAVAGDFFVVEQNQNPASETIAGYIEIATQVEVNAGVDDTRAVTPLKLATLLATTPQVYTATFTTVANTPLTITHALALTDRDAFTINVMIGNSQAIVDVDSVDANSLTITTNTAETRRVTIVG